MFALRCVSTDSQVKAAFLLASTSTCPVLQSSVGVFSLIFQEAHVECRVSAIETILGILSKSFINGFHDSTIPEGRSCIEKCER